MQKQLLNPPSKGMIVIVLLIAIWSTLPWIGMGDYYTKGEPREASVAVSMLNDGNWVLPKVYADEIAYKPPFTHWLMAICSLPSGEVTPFTSRLPSTLAFILMVGCCFGFFCRFMKREEALIAILIFITCFEIHRSSMTSRVDMVLTAFIVCGLIGLFYWNEYKQLKGLPWYIPLLLGGAGLTKGPVGILLPLLVFGVYLLFVRRRLITVIAKCTLVGILSLIPLLVWYYLAYRQEGAPFLDLVWGENFGRFLGSDNAKLHYDLGHEHPFWYNFTLLLSGFIPWTLFLLFSLFALNYRFKWPKKLWNSILLMDRGKLFSLIAACVIIFFYCIPMSKRGTYLMPAYPFLAVFLAQYMYRIATKHTKVNRAFGIFFGIMATLIIVLSVSMLCGLIDLQHIATGFTHRDKTLFHAALINEGLSTPTILYIAILLLLIGVLGALVLAIRKNKQKEIIYAFFGVWLMCNVLIDAVALPAFKDGTSIKPFVDEIAAKYPLKDNAYVVNNLRKYANMYGLNFYLHNALMSFENMQPQTGFFFSTDKDIDEIKDEYKVYEFVLLEETPNRFNDTGTVVQLYRFEKRAP